MGRITLNLFLLEKRSLGGRPKYTCRRMATKEMEKLDCKPKSGLVANLNLIFPACRKRRSISLLATVGFFFASVSGWIFSSASLFYLHVLSVMMVLVFVDLPCHL